MLSPPLAFGEVAAAVVPPGLGDPGKLKSVETVTGREQDNFVNIRGRDIAQQCIVLGHYESGQVRDLSREVKWKTKPEGIGEVSKSGYVTSIAEGEAVVVASILSDDELTDSINVRVTNLVEDIPINFPNQITPVFTKFG